MDLRKLKWGMKAFFGVIYWDMKHRFLFQFYFERPLTWTRSVERRIKNSVGWARLDYTFEIRQRRKRTLPSGE